MVQSVLLWKRHRNVAHVELDRERVPGAEPPRGADRAVAGNGRAKAACARDARDDVPTPQRQQRLHARPLRRVWPVGDGALERSDIVGVGDAVACVLVGERPEVTEFPAAALAHQFGQAAVMVGKEQERAGGRILLAHEQHGDHGR